MSRSVLRENDGDRAVARERNVKRLQIAHLTTRTDRQG